MTDKQDTHVLAIILASNDERIFIGFEVSAQYIAAFNTANRMYFLIRRSLVDLPVPGPSRSRIPHHRLTTYTIGNINHQELRFNSNALQ